MRSVLDRVLPFLPQPCRNDFAALKAQGYRCQLCFSVINGRMLFCISISRSDQTYVQIGEEVEDALTALRQRVSVVEVKANT